MDRVCEDPNGPTPPPTQRRFETQFYLPKLWVPLGGDICLATDPSDPRTLTPNLWLYIGATHLSNTCMGSYKLGNERLNDSYQEKPTLYVLQDCPEIDNDNKLSLSRQFDCTVGAVAGQLAAAQRVAGSRTTSLDEASPGLVHGVSSLELDSSLVNTLAWDEEDA
uniref:SFRICE_004451 n=1 Tax=Spodoptera frugiperda TaxID=7108 RepID=A0A2H1VGG5_SPOFR